MQRKILVSEDRDELRIALLEDQNLVEFYVERESRDLCVGNIYKGTVRNVVQGIQSAFIDIGEKKNAFLYVSDAANQARDLENIVDVTEVESPPPVPSSIEEVIKRGQEVMVQVSREPMGSKGPRVTTQITLPSRLMVLMPLARHFGVARRIEDTEERQRLMTIARDLSMDRFGLIIRTSGKGQDRELFARELEMLIRRWDKIVEVANLSSAPKLVYREPELISRIARDLFTDDVQQILCNRKELADRMRRHVAELDGKLAERVDWHRGKTDMFRSFGVEDQIDNALQRKVWFKSGGYIVIDQTEALTAIDVNSGKYVGRGDFEENVLKINLEAVEVVVRQLRLRDIGGIIVIDFIDMSIPENRDKVLEKLKDHMRHDRSRTNIQPVSALGLVEMTRKRVRQSLNRALGENCPYCQGTGTILSDISMEIKAIRALQGELEKGGNSQVHVVLHPRMESRLESGLKERLLKMGESAGRQVTVRTLRTLGAEEFRVTREK